MNRKILKNGCIALIAVIVIQVIIPDQCYAQSGTSQNKFSTWFPYFNFDVAAFKNASRKFGPFTRWWWPGNDVTSEELQREIRMFADNGFAGVEIQPLTVGINPSAPKDQLERVYSWNSPSFYEHVQAVMKQAKQSGILVDMNGSSGWPLGGPQVKPEESMLTLAFSDTTLQGGQFVSFSVPKKFPDNSGRPSIGGMKMYYKVTPLFAKLQIVIAASILNKKDKQTFLDPKTVTDITNYIKNGTITWKVPEGGEWKVIAFWSIPDGELPALIATKKISYVVNHFDSVQVKKSYDYLFGKRTGLNQFYAHPFRAVFNDSYEFKPDRHFSDNFLAYFKNHKGYDIGLLLAANLQKGYNNAYARFFLPGEKPVYVLSDEDWRLRYDYDQTVGKLLNRQFIAASNNWMQQRGMMHRTQAYGVKMDIISASGLAAIPEAEQLYANGSEGFIKLVTSGAHLYNKPVITQESFVFTGKAEMTTPEKIKVLADKSFTAGINQIIYHGTPYKYQTGDYGKEGWNSWSTPFLGGISFSSDINESYPFWKDIKAVNQYIARSQYALRSGKPHTDVLIYFPFVDFSDVEMVDNPEEILTKGDFKGVEPETVNPFDIPVKKDMTTMQKWFADVWKTINVLNAAGITWEYVNDDALQNATVANNQITINGNIYQSLILPNEPFIQLASAEKVNDLAKNNARLLMVGNIPDKQPGYLNYGQNDAKTKQLMEDAVKQTNAKWIKDERILDNWMSSLSQKIKFNNEYTFTRTIDREMKDGSRLKFIWNQSNGWQTISLTADASLLNCYWLNPENGSITKAGSKQLLTFQLPPYGSIILYASKGKVAENLLDAPAVNTNIAKEVVSISKWNIKAGDALVSNSSLFDWRENEAFKFKSDEGLYSASFNLKTERGKKYFLDLGKVYFTADVIINGKKAGTRLWDPYQLDITNYVKEGDNTIEVRVIPTLRNEYINEGGKGNVHYFQFKGKENTLMPAGLVGPVIIKNL